MALDLFRDRHVNQLRGSVGANITKYRARKPWAARPTRACSEPSFPSGLEPEEPLEFVLPTSSRNLFDVENSIVMHKAFPHLTRAQASDPRLWVRLTHVEGWSYMRARWDVTEHMSEDDKNAAAGRFVLERYFLGGSSPSRALTRNGMSRLWWYAALTHDPERDDEYELTRVLLSALDIAQQLLERNLGRAPHIRTGFLEYLRDNDDRLGDNAGVRRNHIRFLAERLNLRGGKTLLDSLDAGGVYDLLEEESGRFEAMAEEE